MSRDGLRQAAERMSVDKGIRRKKAAEILAEKHDALTRLVAVHAYVDWAQKEGLIKQLQLPPSLEDALADNLEWFGEPPFENIRAATWFVLTDEKLFDKFAVSNSLREGIDLGDIMDLPEEIKNTVEKYRKTNHL